MSDEQYGFRLDRYTANVLTTITYIVSETLVDKHTSRTTTAFDISGAFEKKCDTTISKISSYLIIARVFSIIKSSITDRFLKVVINGQSSGAWL